MQQHAWTIMLSLTGLPHYSRITHALREAGFDTNLKVINTGSNAQYWVYHTRAHAMTEFVLKHDFAFEYSEIHCG
jgi:hypothetical protein